MKLVKYTLAAAAALVVVAPAFAQAAPNDTLTLVLATGDVAYKADGTFSGFDGQYEGTYKIDGDKLCATSAAVGEDNACVTYPAGKVSGDKFTLKHPTIGDIEVTLK